MIDQLAFLISEGFKNFFRNKIISFLCILTIFINFSFLGSLFVIGYNTSSLVDFFRSKYSFEVFFVENVDEVSYQKIIDDLKNKNIISSVNLIDKQESAKIFKQEFGEDVVEMLGYNPLPISLKVFLNENDFEFDVVDSLIKNIQSIDIVDEVEYRGKYIDSIEDRINLAIFFFIIFVVAIIFLSFQIISNTVRLSLASRKDFIQILKYNGASTLFIKIPFFIESLINAIIGSAFSYYFVKYLFILINSYFDLTIQIDNNLWIWIIGFSSIIGLYSSNNSMKRNLNE